MWFMNRDRFDWKGIIDATSKFSFITWLRWGHIWYFIWPYMRPKSHGWLCHIRQWLWHVNVAVLNTINKKFESREWVLNQTPLLTNNKRTKQNSHANRTDSIILPSFIRLQSYTSFIWILCLYRKSYNLTTVDNCHSISLPLTDSPENDFSKLLCRRIVYFFKNSKVFCPTIKTVPLSKHPHFFLFKLQKFFLCWMERHRTT